MKKIILILFSALLMLGNFSCDKEEVNGKKRVELLPGDFPLATSGSSVSMTDLDNVSAALGHESPSSRSLAYTSATIFNNANQPCLYILNFNEGGWAIVSATRKFKPVIAMSSTGCFDLGSQLPDGLEIWKSEMIETVSKVEEKLSPEKIKEYENEWDRISPRSAAQPLTDHYSYTPQFSSDFNLTDYNSLRSIMDDCISN